jgi:hypothetical protein
VVALVPYKGSGTAVHVPQSYPTSLIYLDESGSKASGSNFFVIGGVKLRQPGLLARTVREVRDRTGFEGEFKFNAITRGALSAYYDLIDQLEQSDAHIVGTVVEGKVHNPFTAERAAWQVHAEVTAQLLVGCINRRELVSVLMDGISTPPGCSLEDTVRAMTNRRLRATAVVTAAALDSKTSDLIQVADLVASSILFERRRSAGISGNANSHKAKVAARLGAAFNCPGLTDGRAGRSNIATYRRQAERRPSLRVAT